MLEDSVNSAVSSKGPPTPEPAPHLPLSCRSRTGHGTDTSRLHSLCPALGQGSVPLRETCNQTIPVKHEGCSPGWGQNPALKLPLAGSLVSCDSAALILLEPCKARLQPGSEEGTGERGGLPTCVDPNQRVANPPDLLSFPSWRCWMFVLKLDLWVMRSRALGHTALPLLHCVLLL